MLEVAETILVDGRLRRRGAEDRPAAGVSIALDDFGTGFF